VKDYREHIVATLFGQVTVRLPRFRCAACGGIETGVDWPSYCRTTPELAQLQAHLSALMTYRTAGDLLEQMFPVNAATHSETVRRHAPKVGESLQECAVITPGTMAPAVMVTLDSTFIRYWLRVSRSVESARNTLESLHLGPATCTGLPFHFQGAEMAKREHWREIPTELSLEQFEEFVLPHLSAGSRGPDTKLSPHALFNYILKQLYLGCQWKELPIERDANGRREIHHTGVWRAFRRWEADGCFDAIFEGTVLALIMRISLTSR
jgi:hypothetical protein